MAIFPLSPIQCRNISRVAGIVKKRETLRFSPVHCIFHHPEISTRSLHVRRASGSPAFLVAAPFGVFMGGSSVSCEGSSFMKSLALAFALHPLTSYPPHCSTPGLIFPNDGDFAILGQSTGGRERAVSRLSGGSRHSKQVKRTS
jgi:hypothetical protein